MAKAAVAASPGTAPKGLSARDHKHTLIIDLGATKRIDVDGADVLTKIHQHLAKQGMDVALAHVTPQKADVLRMAGALAEIGEDKVFPTVRAAFRSYGVTLPAPG